MGVSWEKFLIPGRTKVRMSQPEGAPQSPDTLSEARSRAYFQGLEEGGGA